MSGKEYQQKAAEKWVNKNWMMVVVEFYNLLKRFVRNHFSVIIVLSKEIKSKIAL